MVIGDAATYVIEAVVLCLFGTLGWLGYVLEQKNSHPQRVHVMQSCLIVISTTLFLPISFHLGILYSDSNPFSIILGIRNLYYKPCTIVHDHFRRNPHGSAFSIPLLLCGRIHLRYQSFINRTSLARSQSHQPRGPCLKGILLVFSLQPCNQTFQILV